MKLLKSTLMAAGIFAAACATNVNAQNTVLGQNAGKSNTTGVQNTFLGQEAGKSNTTGLANTFVGFFAGGNNVLGGRNSFFGSAAGAANNGNGNSFFGDQAGRENTTGSNNSFFGNDAGVNNKGNRNVFLGSFAGQQHKTGDNNVFLGYAAGINNIGQGNVYLGYSAGGLTTDESNALRISNQGLKTLILGDFAKNRVGIGVHDLNKLDSSAALTVAGKIHSRAIHVSRQAGADFVFANDYKLTNLEELEQFVKNRKHLPEIPSEAAMIKNGLDVGDFQIKLLQKVEELTLYMIEQNKAMKSLRAKYQQVSQELKALKARK